MNQSEFKDLFASIAGEIPAAIDFINVLAMIVGYVLCAKVLFQLLTISRGRQGMGGYVSPAKPFITGVVAAALISFGNSVSTLVETVSGDQFDYSNMLSYSNQAASRFGQYSESLTSLFMIVQALGLVGVFKGWLLLLRAGDGQSGGQPVVPRALLHLLGGALCVYISGTLNMLMDTGGFAHFLN